MIRPFEGSISPILSSGPLYPLPKGVSPSSANNRSNLLTKDLYCSAAVAIRLIPNYEYYI